MQYTKRVIQGVSQFFFNFSLTKVLVQKRSECKISAHITFLFLWGDMLKILHSYAYNQGNKTTFCLQTVAILLLKH